MSSFPHAAAGSCTWRCSPRSAWKTLRLIPKPLPVHQTGTAPDEVEGKGAMAGDLETMEAVLLPEAQELLPLAEPGPGGGAGEQGGSKSADLHPLRHSANIANTAAGGAEREGILPPLGTRTV
jgi:hypothetical protein